MIKMRKWYKGRKIYIVIGIVGLSVITNFLVEYYYSTIDYVLCETEEFLVKSFCKCFTPIAVSYTVVRLKYHEWRINNSKKEDRLVLYKKWIPIWKDLIISAIPSVVIRKNAALLITRAIETMDREVLDKVLYMIYPKGQIPIEGHTEGFNDLRREEKNTAVLSLMNAFVTESSEDTRNNRAALLWLLMRGELNGRQVMYVRDLLRSTYNASEEERQRVINELRYLWEEKDI